MSDIIERWLEKLKQANIEWYEKVKSWEPKERKTRKPRENKKPVVAKGEPKPEPKIEAPKTLTEREQERRRQAEIYEQNRKAGFIYLMRSANGYHKIGISKNTKNRLIGLKRQFPIQIEVVHQIACADYRRVEKELHQKYASKRVQHEWFNLDTQDVEWFISLRDHDLD